MSEIFDKLAAPFASIHWRAQTMNKEGTSAMALAYIDARDVMARLDEAVGPENWEDSYHETAKGRLICTLRLRINGEWISKSDGAGDTDVEGDKGAISDSLKRAAVKWGIGRYLYDIGDVWAECESYEQGGKKKWKKWTANGLRKLAQIAPSAPVVEEPSAITDAERDELISLSQLAGVASQIILDTYGVSDFRKLTREQFQAAKKRLNLSIDQKVKQKEPA